MSSSTPIVIYPELCGQTKRVKIATKIRFRLYFGVVTVIAYLCYWTEFGSDRRSEYLKGVNSFKKCFFNVSVGKRQKVFRIGIVGGVSSQHPRGPEVKKSRVMPNRATRDSTLRLKQDIYGSREHSCQTWVRVTTGHFSILITFNAWRSWRGFRGLGERFRDLKYKS